MMLLLPLLRTGLRKELEEALGEEELAVPPEEAEAEREAPPHGLAQERAPGPGKEPVLTDESPMTAAGAGRSGFHSFRRTSRSCQAFPSNSKNSHCCF